MGGARKSVFRAVTLSALLMLPCAGRAAEIRVVDDADKPLADVMVACTKGSNEAGVTGADGLVHLPDVCRQAYCDRGDRVNDQVGIDGGKATCHVRRGVVMTVIALPGVCPDGCWVSVANTSHPEAHRGTVEGGVPRQGSDGFISWKKPRQDSGREERERIPGRWKSKPIAAGPLTVGVGLELSRADAPLEEQTTWHCRAELGAVAAGSKEVTLTWREPLEVRGRVLDRAGKPVSDVPIFVTPEPGTAAGEPVWTCASEAMREPVSGADGSFVVQIDPGVPVKIDAGWKNYPIGTASRTLRGKPDGEIVLALK